MGWRAGGPSDFSIPQLRGGEGCPSLLPLGFSSLEMRRLGVEGDGCSRWSVAGGDDGALLMNAKKTVC